MVNNANMGGGSIIRKIKKNKFWVNFISWFVTFIIGNAVSDYFGLKGGLNVLKKTI